MKTKTKQVIKEIGKDARNGLARMGEVTGRGLAHVACKASYPVLGNLSENLQWKLERVTNFYYDGGNATYVSMASNMIAYSYLGSYLTEGGFILGGFFGLAEMAVRELFSANELGPMYGSFPAASLIGKLASFPIEGMVYAYDSGKKYLKGVSERVDEREGGIENERFNN